MLGHMDLQPIFYSVFVLVDDLIILANNDCDLQTNINILREDLRVINMEIRALEPNSITGNEVSTKSGRKDLVGEAYNHRIL